MSRRRAASGPLLSRATSTSRCGVPSAAPSHRRTGAAESTRPPRAPQPRGRGQASEPRAHRPRGPSPPAARRRLRAPPCRLGKKVGPNPNLFAFFQAQRGRPPWQRRARAPSRVEEEHGPRTCTRRTPRPPPPRPALAPALRAPPPRLLTQGQRHVPPAPGTQGDARAPARPREGERARAGFGRTARAARAARARARRGARRTWPRIEKLRILPAVSVVLYRDSPIEDSSKLGQNSQFLNS